MGRTLKASSTVEASFVISLCLLFVMGAILVSYEVFTECLDFISSQDSTLEVMKLFYGKEELEDIVNFLKE